MKKLLIFCLISLIVASSMALAASGPDSSQKSSKKLEFKLTPFLNVPFTYFWHKRNGFGANALGLDLALLRYRGFYFLSFGMGLAGFWEKKSMLVRYGYYSWKLDLDGNLKRVFNVIAESWVDYKDPYITPYFKFSPIKIPLNFSKNMRDTAFLDLGIFSQDLKEIDGFVIGMSFSFNVFKKTKGGKK